MNIVLSHKTAFLFWRRFGGRRSSLISSRQTSAASVKAVLTADLLAELASLGIPDPSKQALHLLFTSPALRSRAFGVKSHVCSARLPTGSFLRVAPHVLVSSPELTFMQLAESEPLSRLIMAGCELCGTYTLQPARNLESDDVQPQANRMDLAERPQLTSAATLLAYAAGLPERPGINTARHAASLVFDGAASPMEAKLALLLALPQRMGGLGLPRPTLNHKVILSPAARAAYPHRSCRCDLCWPDANLDVEYDGGDTHDGAESRARDVARSTALTIQGFTVMPITYTQTAASDVFISVGFIIADKLGTRLRVRNPSFEHRSAVLRANLRIAS